MTLNEIFGFRQEPDKTYGIILPDGRQIVRTDQNYQANIHWELMKKNHYSSENDFFKSGGVRVATYFNVFGPDEPSERVLECDFHSKRIKESGINSIIKLIKNIPANGFSFILKDTYHFEKFTNETAAINWLKQFKSPVVESSAIKTYGVIFPNGEIIEKTDGNYRPAVHFDMITANQFTHIKDFYRQGGVRFASDRDKDRDVMIMEYDFWPSKVDVTAVIDHVGSHPTSGGYAFVDKSLLSAPYITFPNAVQAKRFLQSLKK